MYSQFFVIGVLAHYCLLLQTFAMPTIVSSSSTISLTPASLQLEKMFYQLVNYNDQLAHAVLNHVIEEVNNLSEIRYRSTSPQRHRSAHIESCTDAYRFFNRGRNGWDILQMLLVEHLRLLMSVDLENKLINALMFSIYLHDMESLSEIPDIPWSDDAIAETLLKHAQNRHYETWTTILTPLNPDEN